MLKKEPVVDVGQPHEGVAGGGGGGPLPLERVGDVARQGEVQGVGLIEQLVQLVGDATVVSLQGLSTSFSEF